MATSNDTRVRVDGFSKISISTASSMPSGPQLGRHALAGLLHGARHVDDAPQGAGVDAVDVEKMPGRHGSSLSQPASLSGLGPARQRLAETARGLAQFLLGDVERRQQAHHVVARADRQQFSAMQALTTSPIRRLDLDADQQAAAAHLLDDMGDTRP